jgi:hypothetical protein
MTIRELIRLLVDSEIDLDTEIDFCIIENEENYKYYVINDIVDYNDGTCAIIGKRK